MTTLIRHRDHWTYAGIVIVQHPAGAYIAEGRAYKSLADVVLKLSETLDFAV